MKSSTSIANLAKSLAVAQGEMRGALKDAQNPFFKSSYSDLASIIDAIKVPFSKNQLSYVQLTNTTPEGLIEVETVLMHSSGEWVSCSLAQKPMKTDPQSMGSLVSYLRRYTLQSISGVPSVDDDGNSASHHNSEQPRELPREKPARPAQDKSPTEAQIKRLFAIANASHWSNVDVKDLLKNKFNIESTKELSHSQYEEACNFIQDHKSNKGDMGNLPGF